MKPSLKKDPLIESAFFLELSPKDNIIFTLGGLTEIEEYKYNHTQDMLLSALKMYYKSKYYILNKPKWMSTKYHSQYKEYFKNAIKDYKNDIKNLYNTVNSINSRKPRVDNARNIIKYIHKKSKQQAQNEIYI